MNCPRCHGVILDEREREGVIVDVCRSCRGVWLDRGELEKIIARASREYEEVFAPRRHDTPARPYRHDDDDHYRRDPRKKRHWLESLGDIFD